MTLYVREPMSGTRAAIVACPCGPGAGLRFHALNCPERPGEYRAEYVESIEFLHSQDHALADRWQAERDALVERIEWLKEAEPALARRCDWILAAPSEAVTV